MSAMLAVDWGTSSFRLMHIGASGELLAQRTAEKGISKLKVTEIEPFLRQQINSIGPELSTLPMVLCGMVGSAIGWQEVPYLECPIDPTVLAGRLVALQDARPNTFLVPGLKTLSEYAQPDVMRGEETQVVGWLSLASNIDKERSLLCLPGTHSKWVNIERGRLSNFSSALTGELFAVLKEHSILARGEQRNDPNAFLQGLAASAQSSSLLHLLFSTRSRMLVGMHGVASCASYLSGLLIGAEVSAALKQSGSIDTVHVIGGANLLSRYKLALEYCGVHANLHDGDEVVARGLWRLYTASKHAGAVVQ